MGKIPVIAKIALIAGGAWLLTKVAAALSLKLSPGRIQLNGSTIILGLDILNTSPFPIAYDNIYGTVYIDGQNVGTVYDNTRQQIIGNGLTHLDLNFIPLPGTLVSNFIDVFQTGTSKAINLKGHITAESIPIPISETYNTPDLTAVVSEVKSLLKNIGI